MGTINRLWLSISLAGMIVPATATLLGVTAGGDVVRIDPATGSGTLVGAAGAGGLNSMAYQNGQFITSSFTTGGTYTINPVTGVASAVAIAAADIRAMSHGPNGVLYGIRDGTPDKLARLDTVSGTWVDVGPTGMTGVQGLACRADGVMFGWDLVAGLVTIDLATGAATDVGAAPGSGAIQTLEFSPGGTLYGCNNELYTINPATGVTALVGSGGYSDVRGLGWDPTQLIAVNFAGASYEIDFLSGSGVAIGPVGYGNLNSMAYWNDRFITSTSVAPIELIQLDLGSGAGTPTGIPSGDFRAMEEALGRLYAIADGLPDMLLIFDTSSGTWLPVGPTGFNSIQGLGFDRFTNTMYAWDVVEGLLTINPATGAATDVNPALGAAGPIQALAVGPDGNLYGGNNALWILNPATGVIGPIGAGGYVDVRGMSFGKRMFDIPVGATTLAPGSTISGSPGNLTQSDNSYWQVRPGPVLVATAPPIVLVATGNAPAYNPSKLTLVTETRGSSGSLLEKIEAFNFKTGVYDVLRNYLALPTSDTLRRFELSVPGDYVGTGRIVRTRLSYKASGAVLVFPWIVSMDKLAWEYVR